MGSPRHFLRLSDLSRDELLAVLERAQQLSDLQARREPHASLAGHTVVVIFEKPSTRTRVSFEVGIHQLGAQPVILSSRDTQLGRGEPLADTARVLSRYADAIVVRTFGQERLDELARWATVPVINALTDLAHPCQVLSDLLTVRQSLGRIEGLGYAWIGDGNNMAHSWLTAAGMLGLELALACPNGHDPDPQIVEWARAQGATVELVRDPAEAVHGRQVLSTDVWASMGQEAEAGERANLFEGYSLDERVVAAAAPDHIVLHCLPAHRGEEISEAVFEGPHSVVWQQAENRLHAQKALLEFLLTGLRS